MAVSSPASNFSAFCRTLCRAPQGVVFAGLQLRPGQLLDLVAQCVRQAELFALVHLQLRHLLPDGKVGVIFLAVRRPLFVIAREAVQTGKMACLVKELLAVVLAMNLHQLQPQLLERRHRHRQAVDAADIFPVQEDLPLHQQLIAIRHLERRKPSKLRDPGKDRSNRRLIRPGADDIPVRPLAQDRIDRVDDDGLARPRLAGQDVEPPVKGDIRLPR